MGPYIHRLKTLKKTFPPIKVTGSIDHEIRLMEEWIEEAERDRTDSIPVRRKIESGAVTESFSEIQSVFDDIDD
jgi:hypothetical protein